MTFKKLIAVSLAGVFCLSTMTACTDAEKAKADQAAKDLAYLRAQKEKEVAEKEAAFKKSQRADKEAAEYQRTHPW